MYRTLTDAEAIANRLALQCVLAAMPLAAQSQALLGLALLSVLHEEYVEKKQSTPEHELMKLVAAAIELQYAGLQEALRMRARKLRSDEAP